MIEEETFLNHAIALYRQRESCLQENRVDVVRFLEIEERLREQLFALSRYRPFEDGEPEKAADTFIYLAKRFIQSKTTIKEQAAELACDWLLEPGEKGQGACDALMLFPSPQTYHYMKKSYSDLEALRPILIYILMQQSASLPDEIIRQAELEYQDPLLQAQILYYAANDASTGIDFFIHHYQSLLDRNDTPDKEHAVLLAAIWGGMVRNDPDSFVALRRSIEIESDDMQRLDLLRLAALSGDPEYFNILEKITEYSPEVGYHFLALLGSQASVEKILTGLHHPRTSAHAEDAWWWVTGQELPKVARMTVIGEDSDESDQTEDGGSVPDAQVAEAWWNKNSGKQYDRWLCGELFSSTGVCRMLTEYAGMISNDLLDLLALSHKKPVQIGVYNWHDIRLQQLGVWFHRSARFRSGGA